MVMLQELVPERVVEQVVDVPQILEANVEVIKVILQEQCQQMRFFFFLRACGEAAVGSTLRTCVLRQSLLHTRGWILSASDGIWNMLFSTYSRTSHWVRLKRLSHVVLDQFAPIKTGKIRWLSVSSRGSGFYDLFQLFASFAQLFVVAVDHVRSCQ